MRIFDIIMFEIQCVGHNANCAAYPYAAIFVLMGKRDQSLREDVNTDFNYSFANYYHRRRRLSDIRADYVYNDPGLP